MKARSLAQEQQALIGEVTPSLRKPNSKKINASTPARSMRRAKNTVREHLALFTEEDEADCLIGALFVGAVDDAVTLLCRDKCLELHKVEGFSVNQLNALKKRNAWKVHGRDFSDARQMEIHQKRAA